MKRKVIINRLPQADSGLSVKMNNLRAGLGFNANKMPWSVMAGQMSEPDVSVKKQLGPVPREFANLEAEKGETAMIPNKDGIPSTYTIGGKRHSQGGTPLNLPKDSFIFSDTAKMKIKDPEMLKQFAMPVWKNPELDENWTPPPPPTTPPDHLEDDYVREEIANARKEAE